MRNPIDCRSAGDAPIVELRCPCCLDKGYPNPRLGANFTAEGLVFWCRHCRAGHLMPWDEVDAKRRLVAFRARVR